MGSAKGFGSQVKVDVTLTDGKVTGLVAAVVNEALSGSKKDTRIAFTPGTYTGHGRGRAGGY